MTRRLIVTAVLLGLLASGSPAASATQGEEAGRAIASAGLNLFYFPVKAVMAVVGLAAGSVVGLATGGDVRSAYAIWVPMASGTWFFTPAQVEGTKPIEFFGSDYADQPSGLGLGEPGRASYDAIYAM
jgi:hypothetical protein